MRPLTAADIITIWDRGQALHPLDRALLLLSYALPDAPPADLRRLTVGQRNGRLLHLRQITLGDALTALVVCPCCGERLEFILAASQLLLPEPAAASHTITLGQRQWQLRLPTSDDLAALAYSANIAHARQQLIDRCVQPLDDGPPVAADVALLAEIADFMANADPQADMRFALACADCGHQWEALFDIVAFFWAELTAQAKRLLREVDQLARAYGWREAEILALSSQRRHAYLELIGA
jgi:hypothetical protein